LKKIVGIQRDSNRTNNIVARIWRTNLTADWFKRLEVYTEFREFTIELLTDSIDDKFTLIIANTLTSTSVLFSRVVNKCGICNTIRNKTETIRCGSKIARTNNVNATFLISVIHLMIRAISIMASFIT
jgi:hypothetical protein